jgi:hypothetical protein
MKRIVSIVAVGLLVGVGIWGYSYARSRSGAPTYRLTRVDRGPVTAAVSAMRVEDVMRADVSAVAADASGPSRRG